MSVIVEKAQWRGEAAGSLRRIHYGITHELWPAAGNYGFLNATIGGNYKKLFLWVDTLQISLTSLHR